MRSCALIGAMASLALASWPSASAWADGTVFPGTHSLGTGGAMRGAATGDAGPMLNPSGMMLMRTFIAEGAYQYGSRNSSNDAHVSFVDSTSGFNMAGGLTYTYHSAAHGETAHFGGVSLAFPFADVVFIGGSAKYLRFSTEAPDSTVNGLVFDAGLTIRPMPFFSLGAVGTNLTNRETAFAPQSVGGGLCITPFPALLILFDGVLERVYLDPTRSKALSLMGGAEYLAPSFAVRLGGGRDGVHKNGYLSGGLSMVSATGALEASVRQDISGDQRGTFVGVSGRLFVP